MTRRHRSTVTVRANGLAHARGVIATQAAITPSCDTITIESDPARENAEAFRLLGLTYQRQGRSGEAFDAFQKALAIDPRFVLAYTNLGSFLVGEFRFDLATAVFRIVIQLAPDDAVGHYNLGVVLVLQDQLEEALRHVRRALSLAPDCYEPLAEVCHLRQHACEWDGLSEQQAQLFERSYRTGHPVAPFPILSATPSRSDHLLCAQVWGRRLKEQVDRVLARYRPRPVAMRSRRLKVGFASSDFHSHATTMLIVEMIENFDPARFDLYGYSFGPDDHSPLRQRLVKAFAHFTELLGLSSLEAATRIHADGLDILIDLKGYTQNARSDVFAFRPAPIQVNFLGYPGTMGVDFIDYAIVDPFVVPLSHAMFYSERLVHLPHCYQPNDRRRSIAGQTPSRAACGLPDDGFVFCCFNNSFKITRTMFTLWMRLLQATPRSVLWLLEPNGMVAENLRREAVAAGVMPERLVFAPRVAPEAHLARLRHADLFLDTLPYNAHTTASEALWVGVPLLTCVGEAFPGRVAGSLLTAIGLPDLITRSLVAYEAEALRLARDPDAMRALRHRLATNRMSTPLFDTERYVRNFEKALVGMAALMDEGKAPASFAIGESTLSEPLKTHG